MSPKAASWPKMLRLIRTDATSTHMLFNIVQDGPRNLDIRLVGTDREFLYRGSIKESSIGALQATNFTGDLVEWRNIIAYAFLHQRSEGSPPEFLHGVEAVSAVAGTTATITIRRNVGGIIQRLGAVHLEKFEEDVDLFEWVDAAVVDADELRADVLVLQTSLESQRKDITRLTSELDKLVQAKKTHDQDLLSKFAALLNTKKLKIRDQERLLQGSRQMSASATGVPQSRTPARSSQQAATFRHGKRKAEDLTAEDAEAATVEDEGAASENDAMSGDDEEERTRQETPETDDEDDCANRGNNSESESDSAHDLAGSRTTRRFADEQSQPASHDMDIDKPFSRSERELPTRQGKAGGGHPEVPSVPVRDNHESDTETDDEL